MRKTFKIENLDCANCAAEIENAIRKINGVAEVSVSFMTQRMIIDAADEEFGRIMDEALKIIRKVEPDCEVSE